MPRIERQDVVRVINALRDPMNRTVRVFGDRWIEHRNVNVGGLIMNGRSRERWSGRDIADVLETLLNETEMPA